MLDQKKLKTLKSIKADKLFPDFLSDEDKRQIRRLRSKSKRTTEQKAEQEQPKRSVKEVMAMSPETFDLQSMVNDLIDPKTGKMRELVDTRGLPEAKNFFDYCYRILGSDIHAPWSVQMWLALMSFGEVCPRCTNPKYLDVHNIDKTLPSKKLISSKRMTLLEHGVCPHCGATKKELLESGELNYVNQAVFVLGQRSGKSSTAAVMASYVLHRYLMYPMLASMTNSMQASTELVMIFCSLSYDKAYSVLWTPFKNIIDSAQWFKSYFSLLDSYKEQTGKELYINSKSILAFANKNIRCYPTGPKASALRGNTSVMTLLDELGLFPLPDPTKEVSEDDTNRRADSDEAYTSLLNSLATVGAAQKELIWKGHYDAPPCLMLSVSSPISKRDKVMRLYEESKTNPFIFGCQLPTWSVNPYLEKDSPLIASAFKADQRKALRDFGATPTETASPYFDPLTVTKCFVGRPNSHQLIYQYNKIQDQYFVYGSVRQINQYIEPTVMALDAGLVNNSFAIAVVGYNEQTHKTETVCVLEVIARDGNTIDFEKVYSQIILPLAKDLNTCFVVADRWNSADHLHRIRTDRGMRRNKPVTYAKQYSLKIKDFEAVKAMMNNGSVICPKLKPELAQKILNGQIADYKTELIEKPVENLYLELLTVTDYGPTLCPGKAEGFTDDIARAWVLAVATINKEKVNELVNSVRPFVSRVSGSMGAGVYIAGRSI